MAREKRTEWPSGGWIRSLEVSAPGEAAPVEVWVVSLDVDGGELPGLWSLLSEEEAARARRFATELLKSRWVASRAALRVILGKRVGLPARELQFEYDTKGKPALAHSPGARSWQFSLSHSSGCALVAVAEGRRVGVDIEFVQDRPGVWESAATFLAGAELEALRQAGLSEKGRLFYRLWTRKEAILKAAGQGITSGLKEPDVSANAADGAVGEPGLRVVGFGGSRWGVQDLTPAPNYAGALAWEL